MTDTGGPAFPGPYANDKGGIEVLWKQQGMTLRDYFAAKAMQGIWSNATALSQMPLGSEAASIASVAYEMADAMLKERSK